MIDKILISLFIVSPKIGLFDLSILAMLVHVGLALSSALGSYRPNTALDKRIVVASFFMFLLFFLAILSFFINGAYDFDEQFLFKPIRIILILMIYYFIFNQRKLTTDNILKAIVLAALINAVVIYIQYYGSFIGVSSTFLQNPNFSESVITPYRKAGMMSGFPVAGLLSFCGAMICFHFYLKSNSYKYLALYLFIGLTCFVTARTAMMLFFLGTMAYILILVFKKGKIGSFALFTTLFLVALIYISNSTNDVIAKTRDKMFANVINYVTTGDANDYSTNDLLTNHYVFPTDFKTFIFGNSIPSEKNIVNTDVSFFRITWNNGFIAMLIYVFSYLFIWRSTVKSLRGEYLNKLIVSIIFMGVFVSNFKGFYFFSRVIGDITMLLFIISVSVTHVNSRDHK
ncbi:hypothetical protein [Superficieibacter sp.]|uniref:hypothetical protein n=1 Tax=Superficieibacter sp. TaxID=2303322 RepID=UPI0028AA15A1|nr:hypothetical protein [Superficieibacter sp.]